MIKSRFPSVLIPLVCLQTAIPLQAGVEIVPEKELLITNVRVVDSPRAQYPGPFSFGKLMEHLVSPPPYEGNKVTSSSEKSPSEMVRVWLESWTVPQNINGSIVPPRSGIVEKLIQPWQKRDGYDPSKGPWQPNLANAPFRLLAIVNRLDMSGQQLVQAIRNEGVNEKRERIEDLGGKKFRPAELPRGIEKVLFPGSFSSGWGVAPLTIPLLAAAEGRFVFCAVDEAGEPLEGGFTLILEYPLKPVDELKTIQNWAAAWHGLASLATMDEAYLVALEKITTKFATWGGPISQIRLRTNEKCFGPVREMREFSYTGTVALTPSPMALTPCAEFHDPRGKMNELLGKYFNGIGEEILAGRQPFPGSFELDLPKSAKSTTIPTNPIMPVLAGKCDLPEESPGFHWDFRSLRDDRLRRQFSLQTCNGCHCGETNTPDGLHIKPRRAGHASELSAFLLPAKLKVKDPSNNRTEIYTELQDRAEMLSILLEEKPRSQKRKLEELSQKRLRRSH